LDKYVDHGAIIAQKKISIADDDDYSSLEEKLAKLSAELFSEVISKYLHGEITPSAQDEEKATLTKKFSRDDAFIPEDELHNAILGKNPTKVFGKIRAFQTEPGAWTIKNSKQVKLLGCVLEEGKLRLTQVQYEGKKPQILSSKESLS
jgi:methionyl-tRNA formyltransferase